jgi:hypothetical protein
MMLGNHCEPLRPFHVCCDYSVRNAIVSTNCKCLSECKAMVGEVSMLHRASHTFLL